MSSIEQVVASLQKRLQILEDKEALASLLNEYCNIADAHDWVGYANTYVDDAIMTFESWGDIHGKEAIAKAASVEQRFEGLQHSMTNMQFAVDGSDKASGTAYLWFCATPKTSQPEVHYAFGGPYTFQFARTAAGWKISRMRLKKIWAQGTDTEGVFGAPS
jgi:ketosteroid isomerase-like protein